MDDPVEITALTLNCWGLKYISTLRAERLAEIGRRLAVLAATPPPPGTSSSTAASDFAAIHRLTRHVLPYAKFFHGGVWGAGLAVLSRWPITRTSMHGYTLNGRPTAFWRGDWFVGKGLASATVRVSAATTVEVLVTHTHAPYEGGRPDDSYLVHQLAQTWEAGKRMAAAAAVRGHLVLAMGDFNMTPQSLPYQMLFLGAHAHADAEAGANANANANANALVLRDVWAELHPDASLGPVDHPQEQERQRRRQQQQQQQQQPLQPQQPQKETAVHIPTAAFNLTENGAASDNVLNTWRWPRAKQKQLHKSYRRRQREHGRGQDGGDVDGIPHTFVVAPDTPDPRAKRLDYIFYASSSALLPSSSSSPGHGNWTAKTARVAMVEPHPTLGCSVSDHFAVEATLVRQPEQPKQTQHTPPVVGSAPAGVGLAPTDAPAPFSADGDDDTRASALAVYDAVLAETEKYVVREQKQRRWRAGHFFASVAVTIGCYVAVWFSPRPFVAFLLMLLSSLGLATGVVDGLLALLFFGSELRSLREFYWEICNARALAIAASMGGSLPFADEAKLEAIFS
ncbi:sphingomyelinase family [Niveomyces insectorum RCEF 264]|uniref:Sphingomyelinase family n=1 Tax=Niveomyces insectorum RCEF 264 TaxID=1081102 RepID=A0A168AAA8_9HYPO|nr:sphingomyelinase family [Niveomyces insectorum RCEF 264]